MHSLLNDFFDGDRAQTLAKLIHQHVRWKDLMLVLLFDFAQTERRFFNAEPNRTRKQRIKNQKSGDRIGKDPAVGSPIHIQSIG